MYYLGGYEDYTFIRSDNPIDEMWNSILRFSDIYYLRKGWEGRQSEDYLFVSTAIRQSYEYYEASRKLSLKTKPLLQYYSFLNLTKAFLYILNDEKPSNYHGLCKENLEREITTGQDLLDFSVEVNNGVFYQIAKYLGWEVELNKRYTMDDFCNNALELIFDYCEYFGKKPNFVCPKVDGMTNGDLIITFHENLIKSYENLEELLKTKSSLLDDFLIEKNEPNLILKRNILKDGKQGKREFRSDAVPIIKKHFSFSIFPGERYYLNINESDKKIPNILSYFGIMYTLSSIVRYKPEKLHVILDDKDSSINWIFNRICDLSERVYPNLLLNLIYNQNIKYGSSSL